ncbi:MAG TPA: DNA translocase FtsK [Candidatus Faecousia intestinigallinarum]|nr:DNA translocase FtsK [Candidatus Faecousia intestinigallinarum]
MGIIGRMGFLISIPASLYLFFIFAFSGKRPVRMRTICIIAFVLLCGCISHLILMPENGSFGFQTIGELYSTGGSGASGGLLCGLLAIFLQWLCGRVLSFVILIVGGVLTLLGGMQITVPSIVRAVRNRPRAAWEDEDVEDPPEPAAIVVNHLATKRIEYVENQKKVKAERASQKASAEKPDAQEKNARLFRQIDGEVDSPVAAAAVHVEYEEQTPAPVKETPSAAAVAAAEGKATPITAEEEIPSELPPLPAEEKPVKLTAKDTADSAAQVAQEIAQAEAQEKAQYCFPPIDLLKPSGRNAADGTAEMRENSRRLNETLQSFKIDARIINVTRGPSVTRYEVELDKGVRLNKLTSAADDIALSLGASGVRIAAVEGKISVVGIEVPNRAVTTVSLREVIDSPEFIRAKSKSSFAVGKDIGGNCIVGDISKLPHMLIAGTTGSGKSVCTNSIIISLLYKASPEDVRLIMVDPKMVELGIYNGIPHLLIPVVTDPKKAAGSLQWAVTEMMRRYRAMSDLGVRDLESYNNIIMNQEMDESGQKLPQVVVIIDELADLMLVAAKEVEESICRIAQMGRAAGIHLLIATQRPSADVITGLMKANIPSRIAFAVASAMESRIILDTQGAEKLVGKGDMLYAPIGCGKPKRVQGCFVSDAEVEAVATYVKENYMSSYDQTVMEEIERKAAQTGSGKAAASDMEPNEDELAGDEMLPAAVDVILETGQASVSMLQRRLKLGYARAARIVDEMEERGIVGPFQGSKPRAILITKEQWAAIRAGQNPESVQLAFDDMAPEEDAPPF